MEALQAFQPRPKIVVNRDQERAASDTNVIDKPEPMTPVWIVEQKMTPILRVGTRNTLREGIGINGPR